MLQRHVTCYKTMESLSNGLEVVFMITEENAVYITTVRLLPQNGYAGTVSDVTSSSLLYSFSPINCCLPYEILSLAA